VHGCCVSNENKNSFLLGKRMWRFNALSFF